MLDQDPKCKMPISITYPLPEGPCSCPARSFDLHRYPVDPAGSAVRQTLMMLHLRNVFGTSYRLVALDLYSLGCNLHQISWRPIGNLFTDVLLPHML